MIPVKINESKIANNNLLFFDNNSLLCFKFQEKSRVSSSLNISLKSTHSHDPQTEGNSFRFYFYGGQFNSNLIEPDNKIPSMSIHKTNEFTQRKQIFANRLCLSSLVTIPLQPF